MSEDHITVTPSCGNCGGKLQTEDDVPTEDSIVTCKDCSARIGTYGEVQAKMKTAGIEAAKEAIQPSLEKLKQAFAGFRHIKLK